MTDIVDQLRHHRVVLKSGEYDGADIMRAWCCMVEAADTIEQLRARIAELEDALTAINRKASPDPERTMSEASNDLYWCACESRRVLFTTPQR